MNGTWLALDVGGANLKAAHEDGPVRSRPFALWREPSGLARELAALASGLPPFGRLAVTMTAELCDCYTTKAEGVHAVADAVASAFPGRPVLVWGVDGRFHDLPEIRQSPALAAASNWMALATSCARTVKAARGLLIDVGSTTTDLVPFGDTRVMAEGRSDTERLQTGELVYLGVRRTPLCAIAATLPFRGRMTRLAAELFATTLDVFLTLGSIVEDVQDRETADGRPATASHARDRLARMVGADRDGFSVEDASELAGDARSAIRERLLEAARQVLHTVGQPPEVIVISGSGEFLAREVAEGLRSPGSILSLRDAWGHAGSEAACARALLELVDEPERGTSWTG